jgi:hypothetical protein
MEMENNDEEIGFPLKIISGIMVNQAFIGKAIDQLLVDC